MTLVSHQYETTHSSEEPVATPRASVVIPTHNRRQLLEATLDCLCRQTVDMSAIEVIIVADCCDDGTPQMLGVRRWPFSLRVVQHARRCPAASRNAAAEVARAPVLIFLDDDVMAAPDLIEKHLAAHEDGPAVAIGRLAPASVRGVPGWWRWLETQLEKQYRALLAGQREANGLCLYSGNCSISREAFLDAKGFNEKLLHSEDVELGLRLQKAAVPFRLALDASAEHWGYRSYASWRDMAYTYGRWDADLIFKAEFPSALKRLRGEFRDRGPLRRRVIRFVLRGERRLGAFVAGCRALAITCAIARVRFLERKAYGAIYDLTYWKGVADGLGGLRAMEEAS
jgi:glycosyltransferase involved in cell wall biosynthesis